MIEYENLARSKSAYMSELENVGKRVLNSRIDEMQAALLCVKLRHLDAMTQHKRALAEVSFSEFPAWIAKPVRRADEYDVFHIFGIRHAKRDALRQFLLEQGIKTEIHYPTPPHRQEAMRGILAGEYPVADELHQLEVSLPISTGHTHRICATIAQFKS